MDRGSIPPCPEIGLITGEFIIGPLGTTPGPGMGLLFMALATLMGELE